MNFFQYLNPLLVAHEAGFPKNWKFFGDMARLRGYHEATHIACDIVGADYAMSALRKPQGLFAS